MGGQACILYGAAEFSRDVDWAIEAEEDNLAALRGALQAIPAETIYVPPLSRDVLRRGHACHFRSLDPEDHRLRIDVMAVMRGVDPFRSLWERREEFAVPGGGSLRVLGLPDLVQAKKTQRDKDWPMIRRLVEADCVRHAGTPSPARVEFWLGECRSPELLKELTGKFTPAAHRLSRQRPALAAALGGDLAATAQHLWEEERRERELDRAYWTPLRAELEHFRHHTQDDPPPSP